jgi:hypothetical protein
MKNPLKPTPAKAHAKLPVNKKAEATGSKTANANIQQYKAANPGSDNSKWGILGNLWGNPGKFIWAVCIDNQEDSNHKFPIARKNGEFQKWGNVN